MLHAARILMLLAALGSLGARVPVRAVACCVDPGPDCLACCCRGGEADCRYTIQTGVPHVAQLLGTTPEAADLPTVLVALVGPDEAETLERAPAEPERRSRAPDQLDAVELHVLVLPPPARA